MPRQAASQRPPPHAAEHEQTRKVAMAGRALFQFVQATARQPHAASRASRRRNGVGVYGMSEGTLAASQKARQQRGAA